MNRTLIISSAMLFVGPLLAQPASGAKALMNSLDQSRSTCVTLAHEAAGKNRSEQLQLRLDSEEETRRLRNDVSLYSMRNGASQASSYISSRMNEKIAKEDAARDAANAARRDRDSAIKSCVDNALMQGKASYAELKKSKVKKPTADLANSLMTAWLVNVESITADRPEGTEDSLHQLKRDRSSVELDAL